MDWKALFLNADGRIGRRDFWVGWLVLFVAGIFLGLIPLIHVIVWLLLIWPSVCIYSKRLHDMGRTGWLQLIPFVVTVVASVVAVVIGGVAAIGVATGGFHGLGVAAVLGPIGVLALIVVVANLGFLLWIGLSPGRLGPNVYGPPPISLTGPPPAPSAT